MTAMWFGLAAIALIGAGALLYIDRIQGQRSGRVRQIWAKAQRYDFEAENPTLPATWRRGALAKQSYLSAVDIVSGTRRGEQFLLFDLEDTVSIVAVRREIGSDVDIDLRPKSAPPPRDPDMELLGGLGDRVVFSTDTEIARRVCDSRMLAFLDSLPERVQMLWSEDRWTLGSMPIATSAREWDEVIDAVARLSGLLHVLPPARDPRGIGEEGHDPGRPRPQRAPAPPVPPRAAPQPVPPRPAPPQPPRAAPQPVQQRPAPPQRPAPQPRPAPEPRTAPEPEPDDSGFYDDYGPDDEPDYGAARVLPPPPPPSYGPVPVAQQRPPHPRPLRQPPPPPAYRPPPPEDETSEPPEPRGGPFHPGFRPYQGPTPNQGPGPHQRP